MAHVVMARGMPICVRSRDTNDPAAARSASAFRPTRVRPFHSERHMWTKPEFEVVEVTMEVTAYVARR